MVQCDNDNSVIAKQLSRGEKNTLSQPSNNAVGDGETSLDPEAAECDNDKSRLLVQGFEVRAPVYIPPHLRHPSSSLATISPASIVPPGGCPGKTTPPSSEPFGGCQGKATLPLETYRAPWEKYWPQESIAYIRVIPKSWDELENDESVSEYTYIYEDRIVHIWESNEYDHEGQEVEDEIARAHIIWERLKPAADWFYCHTDGTRIDDGEAIPHHAHIIIGPRDEVDPEWWHKAMSETVSPTTDPESVQPECLAPARLGQPGAAAQVCDGKDAHRDENSEDLRGKSVSCTAVENLRSEVDLPKNSIPETLRAIITFEKQSVQIFFSPENALEDFRRKVKELWNIPVKHYYMKINGVHENIPCVSWPQTTLVSVEIKGLMGGKEDDDPVNFVLDGDIFMGRLTQTFEEVISEWTSDIKGD
jgi:hypothetical protein